MTDVVTGSLQVDLKRRTTLPGDILAAAGIPAGSPLVARVEEPGRIVLESPALLLARLQDDIAAALARPTDSTDSTDSAAREDDGSVDNSGGQLRGQLEGAPGPPRDLVAELFAERAADTSLVTDHDDVQGQGQGQGQEHDRQAEAQPESLGKDGTSHGQHSSDGPAAPDSLDTPASPSSDLPHPRDGFA